MSEGARDMLERHARALLSRSAAATALGCSRSAIAYYVLTGALRPIVVGNEKFYTTDNVAQLRKKLDARRGTEPSK